MTALSPGPRHPWELLLQQLTGLSGLVHGWGDEDDAKRAPVDHITWTPELPSFERRSFNVPGTVTSELMTLAHTVSIYGGSPAVALQRAADMVGQLGNIATPLILPFGGARAPQAGYEVRAKGKPMRGGELAAGTWLVQLTVTLKTFVYSQIFAQAPVQGVRVTTQAQHSDGTLETGVVTTS